MASNTINDMQTVAGNAEGSLLAGRYRIVRQLGQGGMGSVWLVEDTQLDDKPFAIKMLPSILVANKRAYRQLKDEALVAMRLVHPNIVQIRAFEENNGNPFLVMDYVDGQTLDDYLAEHTGTTGLLEADVLRILRPIAAALDYAHAKGVVHRDVKPGNVMIAKDGTPYILDFGIAREIQETLTRVTGKLSSGTLLYMSPEQLHGASPKPAQDIYSFAAMVYECLKGEPPFASGQIEYQILNNPPPPLVGRGVLDAPLVASVMAGLAKKPEERPVSCTAVLDGNVPDASQSGRARSPSAPSDRMESRHLGGPWKPLLAIAALTVVFVGAWWVTRTRNARPAKPARDSQTARFERNTSMVEASPSATPEIARISVPIVITNTVEEVKRVVVVTNVVQQVTPPEVPRTTPPPVAANTTKEGEARPGAVIRQIVPTECVEECESLESRLASLESEMSAAGTFTWADEKDVSTWRKRRELMSSITVRAGKVTTNAIALMQKVRPIALANKGDSMVVALDKRVERLYESLANVSARASQQGVIAEGMPLLMKCAAESVELEKELANLQSGLEAIGAVAWTDEKEVSAWEKLHASAVDVEAKANKARARASTLAESIKPVVRASKGDKTVSALDVRVERLNADLSVVAKQAAERLAITKGKVPLTKFANSCRALADGMTKIPAAYARKRERMAEIGNLESLVRTSRTRNYSDLDELARKVAAIKTRSLDERKEEIALGQRVGKMIGDREQFMGARVLYGLRMQVPGESAQAQINAVLSAFKSQINVSSDAALPGRFANIESKAFQLADLVDEDASLQRLENTLRTVQRLAAMQR